MLKKIGVFLMLILLLGTLTACHSNSRGDGRTTCLRCGRKAHLTMSGFCNDCKDYYSSYGN